METKESTCKSAVRTEMDNMIIEANQRGLYDLAVHYEDALRRLNENVFGDEEKNLDSVSG